MRLMIHEPVCSGWFPGLAHGHKIEIDDQPLGTGGAGSVYACPSVDGNPPATDLVAKLLPDTPRTWNFLKRLLEQIRRTEMQRKQAGEMPLQEMAGLRALPFLVFRTRDNGKPYIGYLMERLDTQGYLPLSSLIDGDDAQRDSFSQISWEMRQQLALELAEAAQVLHDEIGLVVADINAPNIWVDPFAGHLCLTDFDSSGFQNGMPPTVYGKPDEFLAPEIADALQQKNDPMRAVSVQSDLFSLLIATCYLLFGTHPLFFLKENSGPVIQEYFQNYRWPNISTSDPFFAADNADAYAWLCDELSAWPPSSQEALALAIHHSWFDPNERFTAKAWVDLFISAIPPPAIISFAVSSFCTVAGVPVDLSWEVTGADAIKLHDTSGRTMAVAEKDVQQIQPSSDTTYTLTAKNRAGAIKQQVSVSVFAPPRINIAPIALPTFTTRLPQIVVALPPSVVALPMFSVEDNPFADRFSNHLNQSASVVSSIGKQNSFLFTFFNQYFPAVMSAVRQKLGEKMSWP